MCFELGFVDSPCFSDMSAVAGSNDILVWVFQVFSLTRIDWESWNKTLSRRYN